MRYAIHRARLPLAAAAALAVLASCNAFTTPDSGAEEPVTALSAAKALTAWSVPSLGITGLITEADHTVTATVPYGTSRSSLIASFSSTGSSVTVGGVAQVSGTTPNDFSKPLTYTVRAEDGSAQDYTVTLAVAPSTAKELISFALTAAMNPGKGLTGDCAGIIDQAARTVAVTLPYGAALRGLVANFSITGASVSIGGVAQVSGTTANNFGSPVVYTVVAADGTSQDYTVTVTVAASGAKALTAFRFNAAANPGKGLSADCVGTIVEAARTVAVTLPYGASVSGLVANFSITGASASIGGVPQVSGSTANNFGSPLVYKVVAADGTSQDYTVTVAIAPNPAKSLDSISVFGRSAAFSSGAYYVTLPINQDVRKVKAAFTFTGASVKVGSVVQTSGTTENDATASGLVPPRIAFTVVAEDGSSVDVPLYFSFGELADFYTQGEASNSIFPGLTSDGSYFYYGQDAPGLALYKLAIGNTADITVCGITPWAVRELTLIGSRIFFTEADCNRVATIDTAYSGASLSVFAGSTDRAAGYLNATGASALFDYPSHIVNDGSFLYVADIGNSAIRKIEISSADVGTIYFDPSLPPMGMIARGGYIYAGTKSGIVRIDTASGAKTFFSGSQAGETGTVDGAAGAARFSYPAYLACDGVYIYARETVSGIRRVALSDGSVTTILGKEAFWDKPMIPTSGGMTFVGDKLYLWTAVAGYYKIMTLR